MAKKVGKMEAELGLKKDKFDKGLKGAKTAGAKFGSAMKKIGAILIGVFAIRKITQWTKALVGAYRMQREGEIKLATVIKQRMNLGKDAVRNLLKQASAYQAIGVISDEVQIAGMQQLATFLKQKKALENLMPAINNLLAQQKGYNAQAMDAVNIANMMGRVLNGQVSSLSRIGITFTETQEKTLRYGNELERTAALAEVITDNVGDMNRELGKTDLGKIKGWQMAIGDVKEMIGKALVPALAKIATWAKNHIPEILKGIKNIANGIVDIVNKVIDWRNKNKDVRLANKLTFTLLRDMLIRAERDFLKFLDIIKFTFDASVLAAQGRFGEINQAWEDTQNKMIEKDKDALEKRKDLWKKLDDFVKKIEKDWKHIEYLPIGGISGETKTKAPARPEAPKKIIPVENIREGTVALANMSGVIQKNIEVANYLREVFLNMAEVPSIIGEMFYGMADSISMAFEKSEHIFQDFWKFFLDFIKQLIIKLIAATIAAAALAAVLCVIGIADPTKAVKFAAAFKKGFKSFSGFGGFQHGGVVPPGYPSDTYPAMLTSGETVVTPQQMENMNSNINIKIEGVARGEDIYYIVKEIERKRRNSF